MKARAAHSITLSDEALALLERAAALNEAKPDGLIFPSSKGTELSDMTLIKVMRDNEAPYTVHGFRSSFRDWAAEKRPDVPDAVAEAALAHAVPDKVVRAYKRAKFIDMRRALLTAWADFVHTLPGE
jgi:integrase